MEKRFSFGGHGNPHHQLLSESGIHSVNFCHRSRILSVTFYTAAHGISNGLYTHKNIKALFRKEYSFILTPTSLVFKGMGTDFSH